MRLFACSLALLAAATALAQQPPKPDRTWKAPADGTTVVAATFLGGSGTDWLCGGGFAPDGSVVLVGNVLGPTFDPQVKPGVIGTDRPAPAEPKPVPATQNGKVKLDKDGNPEYEKPSWRHDGVTAFVAVCSADLRTVKAVKRFPWLAGAATSAAVGADGSIYVAGRATDAISALGGEVAELPALEGDSKGARCTHSFLAKLAPDAGKALWVRHVRGPAAVAPTVALAPDGQVRFAAGKLHVLDPSGKVRAAAGVPGGVKSTSSVNPKDGSVVVGGEHNWATGREPWRCPVLNVHTPDGKLKHQLYDWGGPYVGLDNCRQVSDTAVRFVAHDPDGGILLYLWSDGGNSVATTQPYDVREPVGLKGLGMTTAGANVLSVAYVLRLDPQTYRVTNWTLWLANNTNGKPNSTWVDQMARAPDGSLALAGRSAWGLWQTRDKLTDAEPTGDYVAVLSEDFTGLRFSSVVPGAGAAEVGDGSANRGCGWAVAAGTVNGKSRVLFLAGATEGRRDEDRATAAPTRNPAQGKFAGGRSDGYALLLELDTPAAGPVPPPPVAVGVPTRAAFETARGRDPKAAPPVAPEDGTTFHFLPNYPKRVMVDAEVRDRSGKLWPAFLCGKPLSGTLTARKSGPEAAKLAAVCTMLAQPNGDQSGRVLGELVRDPKAVPAFGLSIESLGPPKTAEVKATEKGKEVVRVIDYHEARGVLEVGGKKVAVAPKVTVQYTGPKNAPPDGVRLNAYLTLTASELGLTALDPNALVDVRVGMSGTARASDPPKPKK